MLFANGRLNQSVINPGSNALLLITEELGYKHAVKMVYFDFKIARNRLLGSHTLIYTQP